MHRLVALYVQEELVEGGHAHDIEEHCREQALSSVRSTFVTPFVALLGPLRHAHAFALAGLEAADDERL